jgi:hypothetical protein
MGITPFPEIDPMHMYAEIIIIKPFCLRYVTDVLNMLQGFYIFIIFVCKRNVLNVIMGKKRGRGKTTNRQTTNKENHPMKRFTNRIRQQPEDSTNSTYTTDTTDCH